jgi:hypothetical protein
MRGLAFAVAAAAAAITGAGHAQAIYRCDDGAGGVLYADHPCRNGTKVDVAPGKADPAAIERLEREQWAYEARQAAREARAAAEAQVLREQRLAQRERQLDFEARIPAPAVDTYAWGGLWPWFPGAPVIPPRPPRPRPEAPASAPSVPARPATGLAPRSPASLAPAPAPMTRP